MALIKTSATTFIPQTGDNYENEQFYDELYGRRVYRYDAVSGAQISIYFGERTIIDDATAVQFSLTQSKKPIYGYHSQYFDAVAQGVVIVHGRIFVNFIHQGYLRLLMKNANNPNFLEELETDATRAAAEARPGQQQWDGLPFGKSSLIQFVKNSAFQRQQKQIAESGLIRPDKLGPVTITIKYSAESEFDNIPKKKIYDVHFIGEGQEIQISGQPVQEMYEFIARSVT